MTEREPRDYHLARRAYEAFFDESPQVWFENLGHEYQMKWVRVARAVLEDAKRYKRSPSDVALFSDAEGAAVYIASLPAHEDGRIRHSELTPEQRKQYDRAKYFIAKKKKDT